MPIRHVLLALLVVAVWGVNFTVIKMSVTALPPFLAAALRFFFAAVPLIFFLRPPKVHWKWVVLFGLASSFGIYAFLNLAIYSGMSAGLSSVVLQTQAFFTMGFGVVLLGERLRTIQVVGAAIACVGIVVIGIGRFDSAGLVPLLLVIAAAISWALANIVTRLAKGADALALTVWGAAIATPLLLAMTLGIDGVETDVAAIFNAHPTTWLVIAFLSYAATLFGLGVWTHLLRLYPASTVAPFTLLVPITGLVSGWLVLGESISMGETLGAALVIAGLVVPFARRKREVK